MSTLVLNLQLSPLAEGVGTLESIGSVLRHTNVSILLATLYILPQPCLHQRLCADGGPTAYWHCTAYMYAAYTARGGHSTAVACTRARQRHRAWPAHRIESIETIYQL